MKQLNTTGIVLSRIDYAEADRIVTLLTPDHGKLRLMARGVRKSRSKLAGGIELFSVSDITFIVGRGEIGTLVSTRLKQHYGQIVTDIERVQLGYELIKMLNKATEDHTEEEYYVLLEQALAALNDNNVSLALVKTWFEAQLLKLSGHSPNLKSDRNGSSLVADEIYTFDYEAMSFMPQTRGSFKAGHIKCLRLLFSQHPPQALQQVQGLDSTLGATSLLIHAMLTSLVRV